MHACSCEASLSNVPAEKMTLVAQQGKKAVMCLNIQISDKYIKMLLAGQKANRYYASIIK